MPTQERSAVEQALVRGAARRAVSAPAFSELSGRSVYLEGVFMGSRFINETVAATDRLFIMSLISQELLKAGAIVRQSADEADIILSPAVEYSGVDESEFLVGIPSIPLPLPGPQVSLPEIALLKREAQYGRVRISVQSVDRHSGQLVFAKRLDPRETTYTRWKILLFFGWRATNLEKPF